MLLPGRLLDVPLLLTRLRPFTLPSVLLLLVLIGALLLSMLLLLVLVGPLLLGMLLLFVLIRLLLRMVLLRSRLFRFALFLPRMILFFILLFVLCVHRSGNSEKQGQNGRARNLHHFYRYCLRY